MYMKVKRIFELAQTALFSFLNAVKVKINH